MKHKILKTVTEKLYRILKKDARISDIRQENVKPEESGAQSQKEHAEAQKKRESREWLKRDYDAMSGEEFEYFCANLLRANGFEEVELTKKTGDLGVDILAKKDQVTYAVQCKCHAAKIGNRAVRDVYSGKECYHCMVGAVMTNQVFTDAARRLAEEHNILLWDGAKIEQMFKAAKKKRYAVGEDIAPGEYWIWGEGEERWKAAVSRDGEGKKALFEIVSEGSYPVEVRDGEYLTVENACLQPAGLGAPETENCGWFAAKVGRELKPGTYQLFAADEEISGYYAVYRTARYMENEKMQSDFFETSIFVFLEEGTYLVAENCYIQKR